MRLYVSCVCLVLANMRECNWNILSSLLGETSRSQAFWSGGMVWALSLHLSIASCLFFVCVYHSLSMADQNRCFSPPECDCIARNTLHLALLFPCRKLPWTVHDRSLHLRCLLSGPLGSFSQSPALFRSPLIGFI